MPRDSIVPFYTATTPHSYIGWGKTTHLGFGIPLMIGAKLAHPDKFCLNMMGDGAFGMSGLDIETSARAGIPITTVILNNGGMATYPGGFPVARERYGVSNMQGNYAQIAEGSGFNPCRKLIRSINQKTTPQGRGFLISYFIFYAIASIAQSFRYSPYLFLRNANEVFRPNILIFTGTNSSHHI